MSGRKRRLLCASVLLSPCSTAAPRKSCAGFEVIQSLTQRGNSRLKDREKFVNVATNFATTTYDGS